MALPKGKTELWDQVLAGLIRLAIPTCNPALFTGACDDTIWLFWPTILDHRWEGALLKFAAGATLSRATAWGPVSSGPEQGVLHVTPKDFAKEMDQAIGRVVARRSSAVEQAERDHRRRSFRKASTIYRDELFQRLGWMPRVRPIVFCRRDRWVLPLYTDTFSASIVAITDDQRTTWNTSESMIGFGNIQPSLVRKDGSKSSPSCGTMDRTARFG